MVYLTYCEFSLFYIIIIIIIIIIIGGRSGNMDRHSVSYFRGKHKGVNEWRKFRRLMNSDYLHYAGIAWN